MDVDFTPLKTFATTRPVMYGAPTAAVLGVVLGLMFQVGPQMDRSATAQPVSRADLEETASPTAWPSGKVPDYVIGTDFLAEARPREVYAQQYEVEPTPVAYTAAAPEPAPAQPVMVAARPARDETRWASTQGDIMDVRLPEDASSEPALLN